MSKAPDSFMPLWIADYLADTTHLNTLQHGAYLLLLMAYWRNQGPLPNDDDQLRAIARLTPAEWRKMRPIMLRFFHEDDTWWYQKRADAELGKAKRVMRAKSSAGDAGAETRWGEGASKTPGQTRSERLAKAREAGSHTKEEWAALREIFPGCVRCEIGKDRGECVKDHIVPIYQGGSDAIDNLQPMCRNCNSAKGREAFDYREMRVSGWRDLLAKRLADVQLTPGPTPSPTQEQDSEAKASASPAAPHDFKREVWKTGKNLKIEPSALGEMGRLCREDWPALAELLSRCQAQKPMDPTSWCFAELRPARPPPGHSKPSLAERLTAKIGA